MKPILFFILIWSIPLVTSTQTCLPGGITFTSQAEIDAFPANYPGCTNIIGNVIIDEQVNGTIFNLDSLQQLVSISGNLKISNNTLLTNLDGLSSLGNVGLSLQIETNASLVSLEGLSNLSFIGFSLRIYDNDQLINLEGLSALSAVPGYLNIDYNAGLQSLQGLEALTNVGYSMHLDFNASLNSVAGLESLTTIGEAFSISQSPVLNLQPLSSLETISGEFSIVVTNLPDLSGLSALTHIGSLLIYNNSLLAELGSGLFGLDTISGNISINLNSILADLTGLDSLRHIGGNLNLNGNPSLISVTGLEHVTSIDGNLSIQNTQMLSTFNGLNGLQMVGGSFFITNLQPGNGVLSDFSGLNALETIGGSFHMDETYELASLNGLDNLSRIEGDLIFADIQDLVDFDGLSSLLYIGGVLRVWNTFDLIDIDLAMVDTIGNGLDIKNNGSLSKLSGFNMLSYIGGNVIIENNQVMDSISGFQTLLAIDGNVEILGHVDMIKIKGFNTLLAIDGELVIHQNYDLAEILAFPSLQSINGNLELSANPYLKDVNAFSSLESINGILLISGTDSLASLSGLNNIDPTSITHLNLTACTNLITCSLANICTYLENDGPSTIYNNEFGCNSIAEVEFYCDPHVPECTALYFPVSGATEVPLDQSLYWNVSPPVTLGYVLNAGTTLGGDDILDSIVVGNTNYYDPVANFPSATKVYVQISPFNEIGINTGCPSDSFYTVTQSTWIGGTGAWDIPSNWDVGMVPTDSTRVLIENGAVTIPGNYLAVAGSLKLSGISQLHLEDSSSLDINMAGLNIVLELVDSSLINSNGIIRLGDNGPFMSTGINITEYAQLINDTSGIIQINNLTSTYYDAIQIVGSDSEMLNYGLVQIGNTDAVLSNAIYIASGGRLVNAPGGLIMIDKVMGVNKDGILIAGGGQLQNQGEIKLGSILPISRYGVHVSSYGLLRNDTTGFISADRVQSGVFIGVYANFENAGEIRVGSIAAVTNHGIQLAGYTVVQNDTTGSIYIDQVQNGIKIEYLAVFNNYGLVKIGSVSPVSANGIQLALDADFYNKESGTVEVNRTYQAVLMTGSGTWFFNSGIMKVGNIASSNLGIYLSTFAYFNNETTGYLEINSITSGHAIRINVGTDVNNFGQLSIGNISNISLHGISIVTGDFNNYGTAVLEVNRCLGDGINMVNSGATLGNYAVIHIGNLAPGPNTGLAVTSSSNFTNHPGAVITINRTTGYAGIVLNGSAIINNSGTMQIGNSAATNGGIIMYSSGKFNNLAGGLLEINRATWVGILVDQSGALFTNNGNIKIGNLAVTNAGIQHYSGGDFINNAAGNIEIDRVSDFGIYTGSSGSFFTNNGIITIGTNGTVGNNGLIIITSSTFNNTTTGSIKVNRANVNWWTKSIYLSAATFTNSGSIVMGDLFQNSGGISVETGGTFTNNATGNIQAHHTFYNGIQVINLNSTFTNHGIIGMGSMGDLGHNGILAVDNAIFTNSATGSVVINNAKLNWWSKGIQLESSAKYNNSGTIQLGNLNVNNLGLYIIGAAIFTNNAGGSLHINNTLYQGIELSQTGSTFINHGNVLIGSIGNITEMGIRLLDNSTFTNSATGSIQVNNVKFHWWSRAISVTASTFNNSGTILEGNLGLNSLGVLVESMGSFVNNTSGDIEINNATYHGIQITHTGSSFINHGDINIGATVAAGHHGIVLYENSAMTNSSTGTIILNQGTTNSFSGGLYAHWGVFTNQGLIKAGSLSNVNFGVRLGNSATEIGTFLNEGILEIDRIPNTTYYAAIAINPSSSFENQISGTIKLGFNQNVTYGIYGGGIFSNYGLIQTKNVQYGTVDIFQTVTNYSGGIMESHAPGTLIIESAGTLHNNVGAILRSLPGGFIRVKGLVNNYGLIEALN